MSTSLLLASSGNYHLVGEGIFYSKERRKREYPIAFVEETKNYYIKHYAILMCITFPQYLTSFE